MANRRRKDFKDTLNMAADAPPVKRRTTEGRGHYEVKARH